ncbi:MAG: hypothetical protein PHY80_04610 [Rickettsiales bacterium]|nr:hypothetical protein [Rickettsiales bacterium]
MEKNLYFSYLGLNERLYQFYERGVKDIDCNLIISLEKEYYQGENMKLIMADLRKLMSNKKISMDYNGIKEEFNIKKIGLFVGDTVNRHNLYYRYCAKYFDEHNIDKEELIPLKVKEQFQKEAYIAGTQEGKDWFKDNLEAIQLFSDEKKLTRDFKITDEITTIFKETETTPKLEYICYNYWYTHQKYKEIETALMELYKLQNSVIEKVYNQEAEYFYERFERRNEAPKYKNLFIQQSKKYLIDETIPAVILNSNKEPNNFFDFYYYGKLPHHFEVYNGKRANNNLIIQKYLETVLYGINDYARITLR